MLKQGSESFRNLPLVPLLSKWTQVYLTQSLRFLDGPGYEVVGVVDILLKSGVISLR